MQLCPFWRKQDLVRDLLFRLAAKLAFVDDNTFKTLHRFKRKHIKALANVE